MALQTLNQMHQSDTAPALPGTWKLAAGRAISLRPREAGVLRIAHGRIWATFDGPHAGARNELGDHVVGAGGQLRVEAGQRIVIEAWGAQAPAYFSWDPQPAPVLALTARPALAGVTQPLRDLRMALWLGAGALARLVAGLAGLAGAALAQWVTPAPRATGIHQ